MGFFDKKYCDVCGSKIGLLGNRKLSDGNLCKDCAAKLSPFFSERKQSTVEEIKEQLEYRERNQEEVSAFHATRIFGIYMKLMLDEPNRKLMVTSASNVEKANPDVLDYSQVVSCRIDVDESKREMKCKDSEGNEQSYNPKQYKYSYDFYVVLSVDSPYFNEIRFKLNNSDITIEPQIVLARPMHMGHGMPVGRPGMAGGNRPVMSQKRPGMDRLTPSQRKPGVPQQRHPDMPRGAAAAPIVNNQVQSSSIISPLENYEYRRFQEMGEEIRSIFLKGYQEPYEADRKPQYAVSCPWCGATTIPTENGCCEYCGGAVWDGEN